MNKVENKWQIKYQSTTSTIQHAVVYRSHMQRQRWPPFAPLQDDAFSFLWDNPHHTVWFPATLSTNTANVCHPPPFLDPISFIIRTMQRTKEVRDSMNGNKKWEDLLRYHDINENIRNPSNHSIMNTNPNPKVRKSGAVGKAVLAQDPGFDGAKSSFFKQNKLTTLPKDSRSPCA